MEADCPETCVGVAACDRQERFAREESGYVDCFSRDGEDRHVGVALENIVFA